MRKDRKVGFAHDQHFALGRQLIAMEAVLHRAVIDASHAYSVNGREVRALERACRAVEWARCVLDDAIFRERPRSDVDLVNAYYLPYQPGVPLVDPSPTFPPYENTVQQK